MYHQGTSDCPNMRIKDKRHGAMSIFWIAALCQEILGLSRLGSKCAEIPNRFDLLCWLVFAEKEIWTLSRDCSVQICSLFCPTSTGVIESCTSYLPFKVRHQHQQECKQVTCCEACLLFKDLKGRFKKTVERLCCSPIIFYRSAYGIKRFCEIPVECILFESCLGGSGLKMEHGPCPSSDLGQSTSSEAGRRNKDWATMSTTK